MSNVWIELGLSRLDPSKGTPEPASIDAAPAPAAPIPAAAEHPSLAPRLVADLLQVIGDMAPDALGLDTASFRQQLASFAEQVLDRPDSLTAAAIAGCVDLCYGFLRKAQAHLAERETEFSELIAVLSEMVATLGGGATFDDQLDRSTERLHKIVDINDIRILKRRLTVEIETLKRLAAEKRAQDMSHRSYFTTEIERLQVRLAQSMEEASVDQLTRVANRGRFERTVQQWIRAHRSSGHPFVLALIDVDNFKSINDTFGHQEGDRVLVEIARTLSGIVRPTDLVGRYGGDEFVVMLAHTTAAQAQERLRQIMGTLSRTAVGSPDVVPPLALTLSIGVTDWTSEDEMADLVGRADQAMYDAKRAGKNRIEIRRRPAKSRLFQNGRPVAGMVETAALHGSSRATGTNG
jgi:diguanylate cyclase (GGDEF)-like protein